MGTSSAGVSRVARYPSASEQQEPPGAERPYVALLALGGLVVSVYLAAYQLRLVPSPWDPVFGAASSERVLTSAISQALPVPDAALGAGAYAAEVVLTLLGGRQRWQEQPWLVALYGLVVAGLTLTSVALVAAQVFWFHAGCLLCLTSAAISFANAWLAHGEVLAGLGVLRHGRRSAPSSIEPPGQQPAAPSSPPVGRNTA